MARPQKHDWINLRLEYNQGKYKNLVEFAEAKGINYDRLRKEFKKIDLDPGKTGHNGRAKPGKKGFTVPAEDDRPQCEAISHKTGERCRKKAVSGERFCHVHLDGWEGQCQSKSRQTGERCRRKAVPGKRVCKYHGGLSIGSPGHQNYLKHGLYAKLLPNDPEFLEVMEQIRERSPLDILWDDIVIQQSQIVWSQRIMFVTSKQEMIKELKKFKRELGPNHCYNPDDHESSPFAETYREEEWEFQFAWDRQATFLKAQSEAMKALDRLIQRYEDLVEKYELKGYVVEEHRLRVEKLKADIEKIKGGGSGNGDTWADLVARDDIDVSK